MLQHSVLDTLDGMARCGVVLLMCRQPRVNLVAYQKSVLEMELGAGGWDPYCCSGRNWGTKFSGRRETGGWMRMKESYVEGVAAHDDRESCADACEGGGEALTGKTRTGYPSRGPQELGAAWSTSPMFGSAGAGDASSPRPQAFSPG
jgi:hypothetical protein